MKSRGYWLLVILVFLFVGCGDSQDWVATSPGGADSGSGSATVALRSVLAQSTVPTNVVGFRATGFDAAQTPLFGPVRQGKSAVVEWTGVPVEVTDFVVEYLDAGGRVVGLSQSAVMLVAGETLVIDNPRILEVSAPLESVSLAPTTVSLASGTSTSLRLTGRFSDDTNVDLTSAASWSSSNPNLVEVTGGVVLARSPGSVTVTGSFGGKSAQVQVTVTAATLSALAISPNSPAIALGTSQVFTVEGLYSDGTFQPVTGDISWKSSDTDVAEIIAGSAEGKLVGQTTITATLDGKSSSTVLTVTSATLDRLEITGGAASIAKGTSTTFTATGYFSDGSTQDLTSSAVWSSNSDAVTVDKGVVQGEEVGTGLGISASFAGKTESVTLEVTGADVVSLQVQVAGGSGSTLVNVGDALKFEAVATFSDGSSQDVSLVALWESDDESVATVDDGTTDGGTVTGVASGQADIRATYQGKSGELRVTVQVEALPDLVLNLSGVYTFDTDTGVLRNPSGQEVEKTGWDDIEKRLVLNSLTIGLDAILKFEGTHPLKMRANEDITIDGTLDGSGADGNDSDGSPGREVVLFCGGDLTGEGTVDVSGGNGVGSGGWRGATGGKVSVMTAGQVEGVEIWANGGGATSAAPGGDGGDVTIHAEGSVDNITVHCGGGDGGRGGDGADGGDVMIDAAGSVDNTTVHCNGGAGGYGGYGGNGGDVMIDATGSVDNTTVHCNGGSGGYGVDGGDGGDVMIDTEGSVENTTVHCTGGGGGAGGYAGDGGNVLLDAMGSVENTTVYCTGGGGEASGVGGNGGNGGRVTLDAGSLVDTTVYCNGGDGGDGAEVGGDGGDGGTIQVTAATPAGMSVSKGLGGIGGRASGMDGIDGTITLI